MTETTTSREIKRKIMTITNAIQVHVPNNTIRMDKADNYKKIISNTESDYSQLYDNVEYMKQVWIEWGSQVDDRAVGGFYAGEVGPHGYGTTADLQTSHPEKTHDISTYLINNHRDYIDAEFDLGRYHMRGDGGRYYAVMERPEHRMSLFKHIDDLPLGQKLNIEDKGYTKADFSNGIGVITNLLDRTLKQVFDKASSEQADKKELGMLTLLKAKIEALPEILPKVRENVHTFLEEILHQKSNPYLSDAEREIKQRMFEGSVAVAEENISYHLGKFHLVADAIQKYLSIDEQKQVNEALDKITNYYQNNWQDFVFKDASRELKEAVKEYYKALLKWLEQMPSNNMQPFLKLDSDTEQDYHSIASEQYIVERNLIGKSKSYRTDDSILHHAMKPQDKAKSADNIKVG